MKEKEQAEKNGRNIERQLEETRKEQRRGKKDRLQQKR